MPNVLADFHHSGLAHSLQLMGRRFGWTVYAPVGHDWWDAGVWRFGQVYGDDRLPQQFLVAFDGNDDEFPDEPIPTVTYQMARAMDWDYIIATVPDNEQGFAQFARVMGAQYVIQVGNTGQFVDWSLDPIALVSSETPILGRGVVYHQEMDPIPFSDPALYMSQTHLKWAASFVNCMPMMGPCWDLLERARETVPVSVYGIDGPEGIVKPNTALVAIMGAHGWGWHDKAQGDGFGHVLHSWAAVGRPLVGHAGHYAGKMGSRFWRDGETCIDLGLHGIEEAVDILRSTSVSRHAEMCRAIREEFDRIDYDAEAATIADLLGVAVAV